MDFVGAHWGLERRHCNHYWATLVGRWILIFIYIHGSFHSSLFLILCVIIDNHRLGRFDWCAVAFIYLHPCIWGLHSYTLYINKSAWHSRESSLQVDGSQDVGDVLAALDYVIENGMADPAKVAVLGGSHGGFLASHLIGQVQTAYNFGHILY